MPPPRHETPALRLRIALPSLPETLLPLLQACRDGEADLRGLAELAARDVAISGKVLALANSAFVGARVPFASITQAVIHLGRDTLHSLVVSLAVQEVFSSRVGQAGGLCREEFWHHALLTALLARDLAEKRGQPASEACYLAGLLHDIGKILLAENFPESYPPSGEADGQRRLDREASGCGIDHAAAGALLARHWNLPATVAEAIASHHEPSLASTAARDLAGILFLANALARPAADFPPRLLAHAATLGLDEELLRLAAEARREEVQGLASALGLTVRPPANEDREPSAAAGTPLRQGLAPMALLLGAMNGLLSAASSERRLEIFEESLHAIFAIDDALLLWPDADGKRLLPRGSKRNALSRGLHRLGVSLDAGHHLLRPAEPQALPRQWLRHEAESAAEAQFFARFDSDMLQGIPVTVSSGRSALLLFPERGHDAGSDADQHSALTLLLSQVARLLLFDDMQRDHAEALAAERIATLEEAARSLAHEICNPLAVVRNYLLLIRERSDLPDGLGRDLSAIGGEVARIEAITRQLNHLGRSPAQSNREPLPLPLLIDETVAFFTATAREKGVSLRCRVADPLPVVHGDRQGLQQALHNLLANAIDAAPQGGRVRVRCYDERSEGDEEMVVIEIADNGPGISAAVRERLFRAGYTTKSGHAGLGLAIVKKLVTDLGGKVDHRQPAEGGALFTLHFPVTDTTRTCQDLRQTS